VTSRTLADNRGLRLLTLCLLYLAQGIPWGFVTFTLSAWLTEAGVAPGDTAKMVALSTLPWTFKWAWGPLIDSLDTSAAGRRRPWILTAQIGMALSIAAMAVIPEPSPERALWPLLSLVFVHNIFNSLQDVSVDALAVDLLEPDERGRANGLMYGSKYLGGAVGGAGLAMVMADGGLDGALMVQAGLLGVIFLFPLLLKEREDDLFFALPQRGALADRDWGALWEKALAVLRDLARAFSVRSAWVGGLFILGLSLAGAILDKIAEAHFVQQVGWTAEEWVGLNGGWAVGVGLGGSILGGFIADRFGPKRTIALAGVGLAWVWLLFAAAPELWVVRSFVVTLTLASTAFVSVQMVAMFALAMGLSWPKVAATQFTAYMAMSNLSTTLGHAFTGTFDAMFDLRQTYVFCAGLLCAVLLLLQLIDPGQSRRELPGPTESDR